MSVHCFLMELKLCNVIICIDGKTGSWEKTGAGPAAPGYNRTWIRYPANRRTCNNFHFFVQFTYFLDNTSGYRKPGLPKVSNTESIFTRLMAFLSSTICQST